MHSNRTNERIHREAKLSLKFLQAQTQMRRLGIKDSSLRLPEYIWRTSEDEKVRSTHQANNGKIFRWDTRPPTGHPGEDYNCRCWAEPHVPDSMSGRLESVPLSEIVAAMIVAIEATAVFTTAFVARVAATTLTQLQLRQLLRRPRGVPKDWVAKPARKGTGRTYYDPKNPGNDIRIQKGSPSARFPKQQEDYIRWKKNGKWLDKNGKPSNAPNETHISFGGFKFITELLK
jgi:SPP1 gp7 family putative phage head morphogenesis protein